MRMEKITDDVRFIMNGEPNICIECATKLIFRHFDQKNGDVIVQIYCPHYGSEPNAGHENYRWIST